MTKLTQVIVALALVSCAALTFADQPSRDTEQIVVGEKILLTSKVLGEERPLLISLPQGYEHDTDRRYPVLYTLDGDTHFQHITGTVDWLSNQATMIPRMIVVAIGNTNRGRDMTATFNNGGADNFLGFIKSELVPYIDKQYRTQPFRILAGHSMAGHFALNAFNQSPDLFNAIITMSPFFHQDRGDTLLIDKLKQQLSKPLNKHTFIYASIGDETRLLPKYDAFVSALKQAEDPKLNWHSFVSDDDSHMSIPSNTVNNALRFVFKPMRLSSDSETALAGVEAIVEYYKRLSRDVYGYTISPEPAVNNLGYHHLFTDRNIQKAIEIFKANIKLFPESANAYDSLAEGLRRNKQFELAIEAMDKALSLTSPDNTGDTAYYKRHRTRIVEAMEREAE